MEIYYLKKSEFLKSVTRESLETFSDGREYLSDEKYLEHLCGIFLTKFIAKNIYDIKNLEIEYRNKKPFFKSNEIFFSISHSYDIVLVAFNNKNIGVDVEYMCPRNYKAIMKRYEQNNLNPSRKEFYRFWTFHEAEIKLNRRVKSVFSTLLDEDYMLTCLSDDVLVTNFSVKKLICQNESIDLVRNNGELKLILDK